MAFLSTAVSLLGKVGSSVGSLLGKLATPALAGASIYSAIKSPSMSSGGYSPQPYGGGGALAMPGGGSLAAPLLGAGALGAGLAAFGPFTPGSPYGGIGEPGGYFGGSTQINPVPVRGGYRMPHQVMVADPNNPSAVITYVRAPRVRYKVSVSRAGRRRCSGGR